MRINAIVFACAALLAGAASTAQAQQGFALTGHYLFNESRVEGAEEIPSADGFGVGAEYVLPGGLGVGVSAYASGKATDGGLESRTYGLLAEANYFFDIPILPVTPYAGVLAGLGRYDLGGGPQDGPALEDESVRSLGFQLGARWQVTQVLGIDARYRRVSQSALEGQDDGLERDQVLVGVTLF